MSLSNYADNLFVLRQNRKDIKALPSSDFKTVKNWFYENFMVLNPGKCHYMCWQNVADNKALNFNDANTKNS